MENHIWFLAEPPWILAYYDPYWHQDPVLKRFHIHRSTLRVSISVLPNTWSIIYKATFTSSKSPQIPGASCCPSPELSQTCHSALPLLILNSTAWRVPLCSPSSTMDPSGFCPLELPSHSPQTVSQKAKTLVWEWQSPPWMRADLGRNWTSEVRTSRAHSGNRLETLIFENCCLVTLQLHYLTLSWEYYLKYKS